MADDVRKTLKDLIEANINPAVLTKDDDTTLVKFGVMFEVPPWVLLQDFIIAQHYDLIITVNRIRLTPKRFIQGIPHVYDGRYPVTTWTVDKPNSGITGIKLKHKADEEVERIFEENPGLFSQAESDVMDDDFTLGSIILYNTIKVIKHRRY